MMNKKYIVALLFSVLLMPLSNAQTSNSDNNYRGLITETVQKIATIFKVTINDKDGLLKGKELDYADWRIRQGNLDVSLTAVLSPFDLTYFKENDSTYRIRKFEYARRSADIGQERLTYLANLYPNLKTWETRKTDLKECIRTAIGLDKAPAIPKKKPILTPVRKYKNYTVENIGLEIIPGVYATGSIYKPYPLKGKVPVVITPNGHFGDGRYRKDEQYRCAVLAQMGAVVVNFDLFAWGESTLQFDATLHRNSIAQTIQVLSAERLLDYMLTQKYIDKNRVGVTGGSGGGSMTMFLAAIDDRIKVSVPVVMTSSHFVGGCPCESGRGLHLCGNGTNNAEIAAMAAPKAQLIVSDGKDWTVTVPELELPFIQKTYSLFGKKNLIENAHFPNEGHDYGLSKRMAMYPFMAKYLNLDLKKVQNDKGEIDESTCVIEPYEKLYVFGNKAENLPKNALKDINQLYALFGEKNEKVYEVKK
ncbi:prolyl oligopeptidase family serine peptidase [Flavobacterium seoulense]|uniref:Acetyl xylan esterase n=1 Tax=Flavobacterium seoulense TaxID=1492738 RepID=A0A066WV99_9FLAO|nr:prolyl oligopeptidase family serine peptidase [Flavobacterium seoulense]KDN56523.1 acetyl xylan esterase [Flavobacterium seoulense]